MTASVLHELGATPEQIDRERERVRGELFGVGWGRGRPALLLAAASSCVLLFGCADDASGPPGGGRSLPTDSVLLSRDSPAGDEDPSLLRAADGSLRAAWFSDRGGNADIYVSRWNGAQWIDAVRVTSHPDKDLGPSLFQDCHGVFHLVWFRFQTAFPFFRYLVHNRSRDGLAWEAAEENLLVPTPPPGGIEDWLPALTGADDDTLRVFFISKLRGAGRGRHDLFMSASGDSGETWTEPLPLTALNSAAEHDHLPVAVRTGSGFAIAWARYDSTSANAWENPTADLMVAESADGRDWTNVRDVTHDDGLGAIDAFPGLFADAVGVAHVLWLTTRGGAPQIVTLGWTDVAGYPAEAVPLPLPGYSPRVAPTDTRGEYLGGWVQGQVGVEDIFTRFFALSP